MECRNPPPTIDSIYSTLRISAILANIFSRNALSCSYMLEFTIWNYKFSFLFIRYFTFKTEISNVFLFTFFKHFAYVKENQIYSTWKLKCFIVLSEGKRVPFNIFIQSQNHSKMYHFRASIYSTAAIQEGLISDEFVLLSEKMFSALQ